MANLMSTGVAQNLIDNRYLHSNTNNFRTVLNQHKLNLTRTDEGHADLKQIKVRLEKLIDRANKEINVFYRDISDYYISIGQPQKAIHGRDKYSMGLYSPDGANEFSRKFLMSGRNDSNTGNQLKTDEQIILSIINSPKSADRIRWCYADVVNQLQNDTVKMNAEQLGIMKNIQVLMGKQLTVSKNMTLQQINNVIDSLFIQNRGKGQYGLTITKMTLDSKAGKEFLSKMDIDNFSARNKDSLNELKNNLNQKLRDSALYYRVGLKYWSYLNNEFQKQTGRRLASGKSRRFAKFFSETMAGYKNINLVDYNQRHSLNGFILEFGLMASSNIPLNSGQQIVSILGQEEVVREYVTEQYSLTNHKTQKTKEVKGASPSDIEYRGASGQAYRFQLKNNFDDVRTMLRFRAQAEIKVSTYLATAFNDQSTDVKDLLAYMLINAAYLKKHGLGPYGHYSGKEMSFNPQNDPDMIEYIKFFLQQSYQFLIGYQYDKKVTQVGHITAGNLAYIFQGRYLIPVAAYFYSALEMINRILKTDKPMWGIGGISGMPGFKNDNIVMSNNQFQKNKINLLNKLKYNDAVYGAYRYPQALVEYGGTYGNQLYNQLSFERITLFLDVDRLEKYFR